MDSHPESEPCERLEEYIRPYVLALLRITIAAYERDRKAERIARAMVMDEYRPDGTDHALPERQLARAHWRASRAR